MSPITHIVLFKAPASLGAKGLDALIKAFHAQKHTCLTLQGKEYIQSIKGGLQKNPPALPFAHNYSHGFVMRFKNMGDLEYYVTKDPAHQVFAKELFKGVGGTDGFLVLDFEDEVYQ